MACNTSTDDYNLRKEKVKQLLLAIRRPYLNLNDQEAIEKTVTTWTDSDLSIEGIEDIFRSTLNQTSCCNSDNAKLEMKRNQELGVF